MLCFCCKKKTIVLFDCRCGNKYCSKHINGEKHYCSYNFKTDKIKLEKIEADKIIKI